MEAVAELADLDEGVPHAVVVGGREIALTRWCGTVYAVRNLCPHQSSSFVGGYTFDRMSAASPGEREIEHGHPVIACPWHSWGFDLASGMCTTSDRHRVRTYQTIVRDGVVYVDVSER